MLSGLKRDLDWLHIPVPVGRDDENYFEALANLNNAKINEVYLGLVHDAGGAEGTQKHIDAAMPFLKNFGVATECGMARCDPGTLSQVFHIHADVAEPVFTEQDY